jgi:hypothetical protein
MKNLLLLWLCLFNLSAFGESKTQIIYLTGEITEESSVTFFLDLVQAERHPDYKAAGVVVFLNSNGGSIAAAEKIGRMIEIDEVPVFVSKNGVCLSACFHIFVSAKKKNRFYEKGAVIGSHQAYDPDTRSTLYKTTHNLASAHYYRSKISSEILLKILLTPPTEIYYLSKKELKQIAIPI